MSELCLTLGVDHVGLTVSDLAATRDFFVECLGWEVVGEKSDYPAVFVSDGISRLTLWQVHDTTDCVAFDRRQNVGLHHLALKVANRAALDAVFEQVKDWPGVEIEFAPETSGGGPKFHTMIREPSGSRIEFSWDPR